MFLGKGAIVFQFHSFALSLVLCVLKNSALNSGPDFSAQSFEGHRGGMDCLWANPRQYFASSTSTELLSPAAFLPDGVNSREPVFGNGESSMGFIVFPIEFGSNQLARLARFDLSADVVVPERNTIVHTARHVSGTIRDRALQCAAARRCCLE